MAVNTTSDKQKAAGEGRLPEGMGGLAKGLAIIEAFSPHRTRLTVSEAAEAAFEVMSMLADVTESTNWP